MTRSRKQTGAMGEQIASDWLLQQGCVLIARNWRCQDGELDIIAAEGDTLLFLEVRTRTTLGRFGTAEESVDWRKQRQVRHLAARYLSAHQHFYRRFRFDVIVVYLHRHSDHVQNIRHIRNAF
ncbi:putative endonuclease [Tumebacillus sp. BK434]|uniref:YraN family protein n=1 Tax=Tumebacillus sp. BK434 TaxID=2512169 RepID=UPI001050A0FC|nr:YraN family protein [Tumebacillus sp. BK434]TCP52508.1 putative endonuclease [Tumebacillus sp. BK434]